MSMLKLLCEDHGLKGPPGTLVEGSRACNPKMGITTFVVDVRLMTVPCAGLDVVSLGCPRLL